MFFHFGEQVACQVRHALNVPNVLSVGQPRRKQLLQRLCQVATIPEQFQLDEGSVDVALQHFQATQLRLIVLVLC